MKTGLSALLDGTIKPLKIGKAAYEWVLVMYNDNEEYLTESQYDFYRDHSDDKFIRFDDFGFAPAGVLRCYKRPADVIKERYPCLKCNTNGYLITGPTNNEICPDCGGTGVKL